ncbi:MAG: RES family NAD+ phosphorylase [Chitinophagaceae bacterium]
MKGFRFAKSKYSRDLTGLGSSLHPGRWNRSGTKIIYTAGTRALALVEMSVHLPSGIIPTDYCLIELLIPDDLIKTISLTDLPLDWKSNDDITKDVGDEFINENKYLILSVPSVVVPMENNYLINPNHSRISELVILSNAPFIMDPRFF